MENRCGIKCTVLKFIKSYLSDRKQKVVISDQESSKKEVKYGVSQGSILGPFPFQIYVSPLGDLIKEHKLEYNIYADDTQLYIAFNQLDKDSSSGAKLKMDECITIIKDFRLENRMKQNDGKTELLLIGTHNKLKK